MALFSNFPEDIHNSEDIRIFTTTMLQDWYISRKLFQDISTLKKDSAKWYIKKSTAVTNSKEIVELRSIGLLRPNIVYKGHYFYSKYGVFIFIVAGSAQKDIKDLEILISEVKSLIVFLMKFLVQFPNFM